jgi:hypothetical protein
MTDLYPVCVTRNYVTRDLAPSRLQKYLWHFAASRILQLGHGAEPSGVRSPVSNFFRSPDRPHSTPSIIFSPVALRPNAGHGLFILEVSIIIIIIIIIYLLTAIGLSPGGSTHLHTNNTQNSTNNNRTTQITNNVEECEWRMWSLFTKIFYRWDELLVNWKVLL